METLVALAQHRNQYYSRNKSQIADRFGTSPSRGFKEINCRTFHSGSGILPPPLTPPVYKNPPQPVNSPHEDDKIPKTIRKSSPIPINIKVSAKGTPSNDDFTYSELWAGPAYSNSPPPSSLPIPKFSLRQKRTASFELPPPASEIMIHPLSKSAPASPTRDTRDSYLYSSDFFLSAASATKDLRRILHLDLGDD
eukprot:TRINITY_DN1941_c0_g3_i1.p1 TRINITY_DN1941_c0_g3~~TRINITY_DN1941_c0_g3_i1.p1  ORF type:complete len:195 (-),score=16.09 TRINITY_DN1941_c0_g3_i1:43-627(-)